MSANNKIENLSDYARELKRFSSQVGSESERELFLDGHLDHIIIAENQALYCIDYQELRMLHSKGLKKLLGYDKQEFLSEMSKLKMFHPSQKATLNTLLGVIFQLMLDEKWDVENSQFNLLYKLKAKNGQYRQILRQTCIYEMLGQRKVGSTYSLLTDLTGLVDIPQVKWRIDGIREEDEQAVKELVAQTGKAVFTNREIEILGMLKQGLSSAEISRRLDLSVHTVNTHRRRMLRKVNCKNTPELLYHSESIGL